jgi:hypothetical protein
MTSWITIRHNENWLMIDLGVAVMISNPLTSMRRRGLA